jgi:hypothetical protein
MKMSRRTLMCSLVVTVAVAAWACDDGNPFYLPGDGTTDSFEPDGTQPCSTYTDADGDTIPDSI